MTNLEIRTKEELAKVLNQETKYAEVLEALLSNGDIYELTVEDRVFECDEIKEFCCEYASVYMSGSNEDMVLNFESDWETIEESMETICKKEIKYCAMCDEPIKKPQITYDGVKWVEVCNHHELDEGEEFKFYIHIESPFKDDYLMGVSRVKRCPDFESKWIGHDCYRLITCDEYDFAKYFPHLYEKYIEENKDILTNYTTPCQFDIMVV